MVPERERIDAKYFRLGQIPDCYSQYQVKVQIAGEIGSIRLV